MTLPVQVWTALFEGNMFDEDFALDMHRARQVWRGVDRIWLSPDAQEAVYWSRDLGFLRLWECLAYAEALNVISIFYVDERRRVFPPPAGRGAVPNPLPEGFYRQWLNAKPALEPGRLTLSMRFPKVQDGKVAYKPGKLALQPGPMIPVFHVDDSKQMVWLVWPSTHGVPPISPEAESKRVYGNSAWEQLRIDDCNIPVAVAEKDPTLRGINFWHKWPPPFNVFFPYTYCISSFDPDYIP